MKILGIFLLFILITASLTKTTGQISYFQYNTISHNNFSFPVFNRSGDSATLIKINQLLQLSELDLLYGYQKNNIFESVSVDPGTIYGGKVRMSYQIFSNTDKVLSVKFDNSSCGATCAYWVRYYNFNAGNGDLIQLKDCFTVDGFVSFKKHVVNKRTAKFKKELKKVNPEFRDDLNDVFGRFDQDDLTDYYIKDSMIVIDGENSLFKNQKGFNLDMYTKFYLSEFKDYLNDFGRAVFGITDDSMSGYRSSSLPQLFEGAIDTSLQIILVLNYDYENKMRGVYAYKKYGRGIFFDGELNNDTLTLIEYNDDFDINGHIDAMYDGFSIDGTWSNKDETKMLTIIAKRR